MLATEFKLHCDS